MGSRVGYRLEALDSDFEISGVYNGTIDDYTDDSDIIENTLETSGDFSCKFLSTQKLKNDFNCLFLEFKGDIGIILNNFQIGFLSIIKIQIKSIWVENPKIPGFRANKLKFDFCEFKPLTFW